MKHARPDYDRFQDPEGLIPENEPVMIFRGQDVFAPQALQAWIDAARHHNVCGPEHLVPEQLIKQMTEQRDAMIEWQRRIKVKIPDGPR